MVKRIVFLALIGFSLVGAACPQTEARLPDPQELNNADRPIGRLKKVFKFTPEQKAALASLRESVAQVDRSKVSKWPGLPNLGATCYLNADLKAAYAANPAIREQLLPNSSDSPEKAQLRANLLAIVNFIRLGPDSPASSIPRAAEYLIERLIETFDYFQGLKPFAVRKMHDSYELMLALNGVLFNEIPEQTGQIVKELRPIVGDMVLDVVSYKADKFQTLDVPLVGDSIEVAIGQSFGEEEEIEKNYAGDPQHPHLLKYHIGNAPNILMMSLKRWSFDYDKMQTQLLHQSIQFSEQLKLTTYNTANHQEKQEDFEARAVVQHWGSSVDCCHYTAWIRGEDDSWYNMDDSAAPQKVAVDQIGDTMQNGQSTGQMYLLLYQQKVTAPN